MSSAARKEGYYMRISIFKGFATMAMVALSGLGAHALEVGEKAPPFTAPSTQGSITLADYLGKKDVVLAFYLADFTPV